MTIFRSNKANRLTLLFWVKPPMVTGSHYEAQDYFTGVMTRKYIDLANYTPVATSNRIPRA